MQSHTGVKPYSCKLCCSEFSQNSHLKKHIQTHSEEKPYSCEMFDSAFLRNSDLKATDIDTQKKIHFLVKHVVQYFHSM